MKVYSGKVQLCETGKPTPHFDVRGEQLFTGDIVLTYTENFGPEGLTVMIQDKDGFFAMGIKTVMTTGPEDGDKWMVLRVKSHADVVEGEHWAAYGFSFRND